MPIYEYKCNACGKNEELLEDLSTTDCHTCSVCGAEMAMQRQYSAPNITSGTCKPASANSPSCKGSGCNCPFAR